MEIFGVYGLDTVLWIAFAVFFYKVATREGTSKIMWTGLSLIVSFSARLLALGIPGLILSQVGLFFAIGIVRAWLSRKD
jgi:hypothetical protein